MILNSFILLCGALSFWMLSSVKDGENLSASGDTQHFRAAYGWMFAAFIISIVSMVA